MYVLFSNPTFLSPQHAPTHKSYPAHHLLLRRPTTVRQKKHGQQRVVVLQKVQHLQFNGAPRFVFQFRPPPNEIVPRRSNVRHIGGSVRGGVPDFDSNRLICVRPTQKTFQTETQKSHKS